ncbi:MAG: exopolysaccharide Pel transporter PelG [Nitrospinaceae bacterium]|nr:MAG: exopolysaccharide Pel transporter PelG [Nitrospinaceae bacterium]
MAGIGFGLRRLIHQGNLSGLFGGYLFSALITAGPWLFTILSLGSIVLFGNQLLSPDELSRFRLVIIYNFSLSLVLSGPLTIVVTRYISDKVYQRDIREIPGILMGSLGFLLVVQLPFVLYFYLSHLTLPLEISLAATANYLLISAIWLVSVFLSALKDYATISLNFALGMALGVLLGVHFGDTHSVSGALTGFNIGLGFILFSLIARVMVENPYPATGFFGFFSYFKKYWDLAVCGLCYNLAIWVDKWIMWLAPEAEEMLTGFISYPHYETAMFLAFLTIIPAMSIFFVNVETSFYEKYMLFYKDIQNHAPYDKIQLNQGEITRNLLDNSRLLIFFQGFISFMAIVLAPRLFDALNINYLLLGMFRIGVLGAFFHVMTMFMFIILFYFDFRKPALGLHILFLASNIVFTLMSLKAGFSYYGYGYFFASLLTFGCTYCFTFHAVGTLPYRAFIKNNSALSG